MSQKNPPGYPLPSGELGNDDIVCQLVYLPDRDEYWQAFLGALSYMATWRAWERDGDKRGKDAASNWREAFELTMECWRMACLEELQANVAAILALMQQQLQCCDENSTMGDSDDYETDIVPGDGDAPTHYGETEVSDWDEWSEYLCHNANLWVDELILQAGNWSVYLNAGGATIGLLAGSIVAISFFVVGGVVSVPILMLGFAGIAAAMTGALFTDAADDIELARDEIICAIISGRDVGQVIEDTLLSGPAWDLFYTLIDYDSAMAILYEGGDGEDYLEAVQDDTCSCVCQHLYVSASENNTVIYDSSAGAQLLMQRGTIYGFNNYIAGNMRFNFQDGVGFCGPMKVIDSISVSDGLDFARIQTKDQDGNIIDDFWNTLPNCSEDINQLVGLTFARFWIDRLQPSDGGCGTGDITITMTYHDA